MDEFGLFYDASMQSQPIMQPSERDRQISGRQKANLEMKQGLMNAVEMNSPSEELLRAKLWTLSDNTLYEYCQKARDMEHFPRVLARIVEGSKPSLQEQVLEYALEDYTGQYEADILKTFLNAAASTTEIADYSLWVMESFGEQGLLDDLREYIERRLKVVEGLKKRGQASGLGTKSV